MPITHKRFHFDLSHLGDETPELTFHVGRNRYPVKPHTGRTRAASIRKNRALALIPKSHHHRITHFVDVKHEHLPTDRLCRLRVTYKHPDDNIHLPVLVHAAFHIPEKHRSAHRRAKHKKGKPHLPHKLSAYGVDVHALAGQQLAPEPGKSKKPKILKAAAPVMKAAVASADDITASAADVNPDDDTHQLSTDADQFSTPLDAAAFLLFHHPGLGSSDAYTATRIMDDHIQSPENQQALTALSVAIEDQGPGGWTTIQQATMPDGTPMTYELKLGRRNVGDPVQQYVPVPDVLNAMPAALQQPLKTSADDPALQNKKWSVTQGATAIHQTNVAKPDSGTARLLRAGAPSRFKWTLKEQNHSNGLSVDSDSIRFDWNEKNDGSGTFQIKATNTHLRTLAAYIEFIDESGNVIDEPEGWRNLMIPSLQTSRKKFISVIGPVGNIMGIPIPAFPTLLKFPWPKNATSARLLFGGLGKGDWDGDVCIPGTVLTGIFQYGIPVMMLAMMSSDKDSSFIDDFLSDPTNVQGCLLVAGSLVYVGLKYPDSQEILKSFAVTVGGILVKRGFEKVLGYVLANITEDDAEEAVPFVGFVIFALNISVAAAQITATTLQVTSSPATIRYDIARAFDLNVTVKPDPAHGEPGKPETAVWPAVSDNYEVIVQYERGTNFVQTGTMPKKTAKDPIALTFPELPAGGRLQIIAAIYSESGWLCGKWTSGWMAAVPADGNTLTVPPGTIEEQLVPLTTDSQYAYKEKIIYDATENKHVWKDGTTPPTDTIMNLSSSNTGPALSKLVNLTIFERTFEIGYTWQAASQGLPMTGETTTNSGQAYAFRNLSVLADPESRLKFPNRSFAAQPFLVYDQYGQPTDPGSGTKPHQFFIDPRGGKCHLREIVLDDENSTIDLTASLKSWGQFPPSNIDAMVINSGKVIGASWANHNLAILTLPEAASDDAHAPTPTIVSGEGVRQGLLGGPVAMAVTPDGRLLVLETINQRIQAFDLSGNPVPCFDGPKLFSISADSFSANLDQRAFSAELQSAFRLNEAGHLFDLDLRFVGDLDQAKLSDDLRDAFGLEGIFLSVGATDPNDNAVVTVATPSHEWRIETKVTNRQYVITKADQKLVVYALLNNTEVTVRAPGQQWIVRDNSSAVSYKIKVSSDQAEMLDVCFYNSYMPLENPTPGKDATFLDLATEARGYIYVLCYTDSGTQTTDYFLDIYEPNGAFLCRTPDSRYTSNPQNVVAARLVVDTWRNAFTLNYEALAGPNGSTEPSIGHWMPMPPLFSLELSDQPSFDKADKASVRNIFGTQHKPISLGDGASIATISHSGHWKVTDGSNVYDVIRSGDKLDVYILAPGARI